MWREMIRTYGRRPLILIGVAALVFIPVGLIGAVDNAIQGPLLDVDADDHVALRLIAATGVASIDAAIATIGNVFYSGVIAAVVLALRQGRAHSLAHVARTLPYWRLLVIDLVITLAVAIGLLLLIVPGLFLLARLVLAPSVELEGLTVRAALGRSWRLVRGNTLRMLALVLPIIVAQALLTDVIQSSAILSVGDTFLGDWFGSALANLVTAPFFALAIVVSCHELSALRARSGPPRAAEVRGSGS